MPDPHFSRPRAPAERPLDIVSHGRRGPGAPGPFTSAQIDTIARTVRRTPEVMVKVSGGARDVGGARAHVDYVGRHGRLALELDDGQPLSGRDAGLRLVDDWNLDLSRGQYRPKPADGQRDSRPKLVHNIVLSMPGRTPPEAVLAAARRFAREEFALQYRYALVLHTDQAHPHVHLLVKAEHEHEPNQRLYIRKATLRHWREAFATYLREEGVAANATPAAVRGRPRTGKKDPIHQRLLDVARYDALAPEAKRVQPRPVESTFMRAKVEAVLGELRGGRLQPEPGLEKIKQTRAAVEAGWHATAEVLGRQGELELAQEVEQFVKAMPPARTEKQQIAAGLVASMLARRQVPPSPPDPEPAAPTR
jgi:hypothetical protein